MKLDINNINNTVIGSMDFPGRTDCFMEGLVKILTGDTIVCKTTRVVFAGKEVSLDSPFAATEFQAIQQGGMLLEWDDRITIVETTD